MENDWLQGWTGFLLGEHVDQTLEKQVDETTNVIYQELYEKYSLHVNKSLLRVSKVKLVLRNKF